MTENVKKRIRLGVVGGGTNSFIGYVHRIASRIDGEYEVVAGALSSVPGVATQSGQDLGLDDDRIYTDYRTMARIEASRGDGIQAVSIVTPNNMHFAPAKAFLEAGIHVICEKPLTSSFSDSIELENIHRASGAKFLLTHNYTGYPLVRQARNMVYAGTLGEIRVIQVEYPQDWLTEEADNKQANWRVDPSVAGIGGCVGDIGTHAFNLAQFVSGLKTMSVSADLHTFVKGRQLDDNVHIMLRYQDGARGMLWASQVAPGQENGLRLRIYGTKGGIEWAQADPNKMWFNPFGQPRQLHTRGGANAFDADVAANVRIPAGHPEGYLEAFATLYSDFADVIRSGKDNTVLPSLQDGIEGMEFILAAVSSSNNQGIWTELRE